MATRDSRGTLDCRRTKPGTPAPSDLAGNGNPPASASTETRQDGHDFLTVTSRLETAKGSAPVVAVLSYSLDEALADYRSIVVPLLVVLVLALAAALAGAMLIVRGVSRPLELLAGAARRIASGDYTDPPRLQQRDEVGHLADALISMTHSIAEREAALKHAVESTEIARERGGARQRGEVAVPCQYEP